MAKIEKIMLCVFYHKKKPPKNPINEKGAIIEQETILRNSAHNGKNEELNKSRE